MFTEIERFGAYMVGNQVTKDAHAGVFGAVARTMQDYLGLKVPVLGWLHSSDGIYESVNRRRPLVLDPHSKDTAAFRTLAKALVASLPADDDLGIIEDVVFDEPSAA